VWSLIQGFNSDIKAWLKIELEKYIKDLQKSDPSLFMGLNNETLLLFTSLQVASSQ
jgi:hypothetical protein